MNGVVHVVVPAVVGKNYPVRTDDSVRQHHELLLDHHGCGVLVSVRTRPKIVHLRSSTYYFYNCRFIYHLLDEIIKADY